MPVDHDSAVAMSRSYSGGGAQQVQSAILMSGGKGVTLWMKLLPSFPFMEGSPMSVGTSSPIQDGVSG